MEENEHINEHLKNSLRGFTVPPRLDSFDAIQKKLEKKRRRRFLFFLLPGLLLLAGAGLWLADANTISPVVVEQHTIAQHNETPSPETSIKNAPPQHQHTPGQETHKEPQDKTPPQEPAGPEGPGDAGNEPTGTTAEQMPEPAGGQATQPGKTNKYGNIHKSTDEKIKTGKHAEVNLTKHTQKTEAPQELFAAADPSGKPGPDALEKPVPVASPAEKEPVPEPLITEADELASKTLLLPLFLKDPALLPEKENALLLSPDSLKKPKRFHYYVGAYITPQYMSYLFARNKTGEYPIAYLKNKRAQNKAMFAYGWGLKAAVRVDKKWEFAAGIDFQTYKQEEKLKKLVPVAYAASSPTATPVQGPSIIINNTNEALEAKRGFVWNTQANITYPYLSIYKYWGFSLEAARIYTFRHRLKIKLGAGLRMSSIRYFFFNKYYEMMSVREPDTYYYDARNYDIRRNLVTLDVKAGLIEDLTKRLQVQFCPVLFYNFNSMFVKNYLIQQRAYGAGLECSLLFRLR